MWGANGEQERNPAGLQDCLPWGLSESELKQRNVNGNWKWGNKRISVDIILEFINYLIAYEKRFQSRRYIYKPIQLSKRARGTYEVKYRFSILGTYKYEFKNL